MLITYFGEAIHPYLLSSFDYLGQCRLSAESDKTAAGINFSILLGSACYLESVLEAMLRELASNRRKQLSADNSLKLSNIRERNGYVDRLSSHLSLQITETTGCDRYCELFKLFTNKRLKNLPEVQPHWEGISVLFSFRNVLSHGREIYAVRKQGAVVPNGRMDEFSGGYLKAEQYLLKRKLMNKKLLDAKSNFHFLSNPIADHFWSLSKQIPDAIIASFDGDIKTACQKALNDPSVIR